MTERILAAVRHPWSDSIGHPTGRLLNVRNGYEFETDAVFTAAAETGTAMEINAMPDRLDLSDELARRAVDMGVGIVINTDAHATEHLGLLPYGNHDRPPRRDNQGASRKRAGPGRFARVAPSAAGAGGRLRRLPVFQTAVAPADPKASRKNLTTRSVNSSGRR